MRITFSHLSLTTRNLMLCAMYVFTAIVSLPVLSLAQGPPPNLGCWNQVGCAPTSMNLNGLVQLVVCKDPNLPPGLSCLDETCTVSVQYQRITCQLGDGTIVHRISIAGFCSECGPPVRTSDLLLQIVRSILRFHTEPATDPLGLTAGNPERIHIQFAFNRCIAMVFCPSNQQYCAAKCSCPSATTIGGGIGGVRTSPCNECCQVKATMIREDCRYRFGGSTWFSQPDFDCLRSGAVPDPFCMPFESDVLVEECNSDFCNRFQEILSRELRR